jgi:hypothetical protein
LLLHLQQLVSIGNLGQCRREKKRQKHAQEGNKDNKASRKRRKAPGKQDAASGLDFGHYPSIYGRILEAHLAQGHGPGKRKKNFLAIA